MLFLLCFLVLKLTFNFQIRLETCKNSKDLKCFIDEMRFCREGLCKKQTSTLFRFLILVHVCATFPLKCPEPAQWSLRARSHCPDPSKYFCLKDDLINGYSENCTVFDFLRPGRKHVLRGGLDADICLSERYQPWPIKFYTNVSTNCIFGKSECNEEGQVVNDNGNQTTDTTCRCDYTKGYDFLSKPRNPCFCVPSEEDCSCFRKTCPDSTFQLSPDYKCINSRMNISTSQCIPLMTGRDKRGENQSHTEYITRTENISTRVQWKNFSAISTLCTFIAYIETAELCCKFDDTWAKNIEKCLAPVS